MAETTELIREDIARTRAELGDTLDALAYKKDVSGRTKGWVAGKKDAAVGAGTAVASKVSGATDSLVARVSGITPSSGEVQAGAGRVKDTAEQAPLGLALAGAAVGFVAGLFAPSTRLEDEKLGPAADQVKSTAVEAGQAALEHSKEVAQATAESAIETAKQEGQQHAEQVSSSLQDQVEEA